MRAKGEPECDHVMNIVKAGVRLTADEFASRALDPIAGPLVVQAGEAAVKAVLDDEDEGK